jgi:ribosome biogenesis protein SSF1/2
MSGPLNVTHLMVFSQPSSDMNASAALASEDPEAAPAAKGKKGKKNSDARPGESAEDRAERTLMEGTTTVNLRLIRLPRGPTLNFKVLRYSLAMDVLRMARRPRAIGREFAEAPLVRFFLFFWRLGRDC